MSKTGNRSTPSPLDKRDQLRICQVRAVESTSQAPIAGGRPITDALDLGRLADFIQAAGPLAPVVVASSNRPEVRIDGQRSGKRDVGWQRFRLQTAAGRLVDLRMFSSTWVSLGDTIALLEDLHYESLDGQPDEWDRAEADSVEVDLSTVSPFHQLVFMPDMEPEPSWETVQRLVYRADLDAIEEHSSIGHPEEINRRPGQLAAVGSFGSVLWGIQDYVESSLVLSASLAVSALACIQAVRLQAIEHLHRCQVAAAGGEADGGGRHLAPAALAAMRQDLCLLEADLTFGAEASAVISPLLQSLRVESYHRALFAASDVITQAGLVGRMLTRLRSIVETELDAAATS